MPKSWRTAAEEIAAIVSPVQEAATAEALRLNPAFSLEVARQSWPYKNPADLEQFIAGLRKAGLK